MNLKPGSLLHTTLAKRPLLTFIRVASPPVNFTGSFRNFEFFEGKFSYWEMKSFLKDCCINLNGCNEKK